MNYDLLDKINSPEDLRAIPEEDIPRLCEQMRAFLVENVERTGGHLASNLGVTELSVALHRVFDSPRDKIIFDVGHQSYVHKIITGRKCDFADLRRPGGLSGFTCRKESEHDPFGAGHSSTSISAALGFAEANAMNGSDAYTVCVIGDGAYTGGMVHEALNNCKPDLRLIIVINENRMSISRNKGTFASYLAKIRISEGYMKWKRGTTSVVSHIPLIGKPLYSAISFIKSKIKKLIYKPNYFEELGLYYLGPVNGNKYSSIEKALEMAKKTGKCAVIHAYTIKGKGYEPAERSPDGFHSVSPSAGEPKSFHAVFADELINLADADKDIVAVTAAMGMGTGLDAFGKKYSERYFDVGIAEEHALTFSAALAAAGKKPYVAIYSTFLQRGYDNILHDIALQNLPVRIMIDRASLAVNDGATHHGIFDVAFLSHIPNVSIVSPATYGTLCEAIRDSQNTASPIAIRYPNCEQDRAVRDKFYPDSDYSGYGVVSDFDKDEAPELVFITYGRIVSHVMKAQKLLCDRGIRVGIVLVEKLKPYAPVCEKIGELIAKAKGVLFVEEGIMNGGFSMICAERMSALLADKHYDISAIDDNFAIADKPCDLYDYLGLSPEALCSKMLKIKDKCYDN